MSKVVKLYQCDGCREVHDHHWEAEECCQPEVNEVFQCPDCSKVHDERDAAEECCGEGAIKCPRCRRDHGPSTIAYHAIQIAGHCQTCNPFFTLDQQLQIEDSAKYGQVDAWGYPAGDSRSILRGERQSLQATNAGV